MIDQGQVNLELGELIIEEAEAQEVLLLEVKGDTLLVDDINYLVKDRIKLLVDLTYLRWIWPLVVHHLGDTGYLDVLVEDILKAWHMLEAQNGVYSLAVLLSVDEGFLLEITLQEGLTLSELLNKEVVAVRHQTLEDYLDTLRSQGLELELLSYELFSLLFLFLLPFLPLFFLLLLSELLFLLSSQLLFFLLS